MADGKILIVDDESEIRELVGNILRDEGYQVQGAGNAAEARIEVDEALPDMVLLDIWMPDMDGISLLKEWRQEEGLPFHVVMMSGHGTIETAVEATRLGAYDFLEKPLSMAKLLLMVSRTMQAIELARENARLRNNSIVIEKPLGESPIIRDLLRQVANVARHHSPVLLKGEAGSGRESCARYIHYLGKRHGRPFITLRIGAIASENYQAAIFGREHNGEIYSGHLEQADGGTLFLDEVADLDADTQVRLLSALQESSFLRVDGTQPVSVDVRIIASTRSDLELEVREGRFRDDLYFFLNVLPVYLPTLREHAEDIPAIVHHYVNYYIQRDRLPDRMFSDDAMMYLREYGWPGNIREIKNIIQRLLILGNNRTISSLDVQRILGTSLQTTEDTYAASLTQGILELPIREAREHFERDYLLHQWKRSEGSVSRLAKKIGMERTHLYRKLKNLGIDHKKITIEQ